jgi:hypothetical protein
MLIQPGQKGRSIGHHVGGPLRLPRRFASHLGALGNEYRRHFQALAAKLGPFTDELQRQAAADVAQAHVVKLCAVRAWEEAQTQRATGRGRRPNTQMMARLQKRVALEASSYTLAFNRLVLLTVPPTAKPPSVASLFKAGP